jgi:nucleotide-binding universal stress UspA family protein
MSSGPGRVVVGVSGTPSSLEALRTAVAQARRRQERLLAVLCWQPPGGEVTYARAPSPDLVQLWQGEAAARLRNSFDEALGGPPEGIDLEPLVVRGGPGPSLVAIADRPGDLLVVGGGERGWPARLFHGRTARYCVAHASCPVLAVPPPALLSALPPLERHRLPRPLIPA